MVTAATLLAFLLVLASVLPAPARMAGPAAAAGLALSISISPDNVIATATDAYPLTVLSGIAMVDQSRIVETVVELTASSSWVCQVNPTVLHFEGDYPQTFSVTVHVPFGALPTETCEVVVSGVCKVGGVAVSNATATAWVHIRDYPVFKLDLDIGQGYLVQGEDREIRLRVHNRANVPLRLDLSVKAAPDGATVILPPGSPEFGPYDIANYTFELRTDDDIATDYQFITLLVRAFDTSGGEVQTKEFIIPLDIESRSEDMVENIVPMLIVIIIAMSCAAVSWRHKRRKSRRAGVERGDQEGMA